MKVTYDVTVRVVVDVAGYAAEYDVEGSAPDDVLRMIRTDMIHSELANTQHHDWIAGTHAGNLVTCTDIDE